MGLPCSSNSEGFICLYVDRNIMLTPSPVPSLLVYLLVCNLFPTNPISWEHQYPCKCLVTPCFVGLMELLTSLGTIGGVVLRLYMYGVYSWNVLFVCGL